jgi:chromosome segregation ATPase
MEIENRSSNIGQENKIAGDKATALLKEFEFLGKTFKKSLSFKEKIRSSLDEQLADFKIQKKDNDHRLETLESNIRIYEENLGKISLNVDELNQKESLIKKRYESLLKGSLEKDIEVGCEDSAEKSGALPDSSTLESLIEKRRNFLDNLNENFKRLDSELMTIAKLRKEILTAREGILDKKESALQNKMKIEEHGNKIREGLQRVSSELEKTIQEEKVITDGLIGLLTRIEKCMELSAETDPALFSALTVAESQSCCETADRALTVNHLICRRVYPFLTGLIRAFSFFGKNNFK